ncbi:BQ2448_2302 [Microbotryum intermedium]|uniref:BQ2448_2302 protein n=1 Tax=Microbotryum intermedium TaxID=269621 RepID=A0A238F5S0_9BASI|nr:BQ2448_2302 [Microbotryum intermedium]
MVARQGRNQRMLRWLITGSKNPTYFVVVSFDGERLARLAQRGSERNSTLSASTAVSTSTLKTHHMLDFSLFRIQSACMGKNRKLIRHLGLIQSHSRFPYTQLTI